jgi:hypothetical protein
MDGAKARAAFHPLLTLKLSVWILSIGGPARLVCLGQTLEGGHAADLHAAALRLVECPRAAG